MPPETDNRTWLGWCMYDWANSAFATICLAAVLPVYFISLVPSAGAAISAFGFSRTIPAASLWGYTVAASMLVVALAAPYLGAIADQRRRHRRYLLGFCLAGSLATMLLAAAGPGNYLTAAVFFAIANIGFAGGNIFYNSYLPAIATEKDLDILSARGFAAGYLGGGLALLLLFLLIQFHHVAGLADKATATRIGFIFCGLWWLVFSIPTFRYLPTDAGGGTAARIGGISGYLLIFSELRRFPDLLRFLVAFLLYNDGIQTIIVVAAIFGREELGLSQTSILGCFLMIQFAAMPGALLFGHLSAKYGQKPVISLALMIFIAVTVYAFFIHSSFEFWLLGLVIALVLGGSQSISRSLFGSLIPPRKNAEFFGFYAISNKFASIFGPFVFALIAELTGSTRLSILALSAFFIIGLALLTRVDPKRGRALAKIAP